MITRLASVGGVGHSPASNRPPGNVVAASLEKGTGE